MLSGGEKFFARTVKVLSDEGLGKNKLLSGGEKFFARTGIMR